MNTFAKPRINSTVEFSNLKLKIYFKNAWGKTQFVQDLTPAFAKSPAGWAANSSRSDLCSPAGLAILCSAYSEVVGIGDLQHEQGI